MENKTAVPFQKKKVKKISCWLLLLLISLGTSAQTDSAKLRISILTCAPGSELYSTFGHTAVRITDSITQTDLVYNYGTFDFNDPNFYSKFTRGKLDYFLSVSDLPSFMYEYQSENRTVHEQVLLLSIENKKTIQQALTNNLTGAARYYKYDFLYNNCTSRIRDILIQYAGLPANQLLVPKETTFRNMLHEYLDKGNQSWSKLGIDLLLGSLIDKKVNIPQSMFLPDYLMKGIDSSVNSEKNILQQKIILNQGASSPSSFVDEPLIIFSIFSGILLFLSFLKYRVAKLIVRWVDFLLLLITGLIGCLLIFMWFGTDHKACAANFNLLWALPTNLVAAIAFWKNPQWLVKYFRMIEVIYFVLLIFNPLLPQEYNTGFFAIIVLMELRLLMLRRNRLTSVKQ